jgi:AraC-like DNA-binding protein
LHVAEAVPAGTYRVIHFLSAHSATLGEAFARICTYSRWADDGGCIRVVHDGPYVGVELIAQGASPCASLQQTEFVLATCYLGVKRSSRLDFSPRAVELSAPPPADLSPRLRVFGCPVHYGRSRNCLWFERADWVRAIPGADSILLSLLEAHAQQLVTGLPTEPPLIHAVHGVVMRRMADGIPTVQAVARELGTSTRALQRALLEASTSYSRLLDEARLSAARNMLHDRRLSISQISLHLGFSEQSAFTRAYKRWTGSSPAQTRSRSSAHDRPAQAGLP